MGSERGYTAHNDTIIWVVREVTFFQDFQEILMNPEDMFSS